MAKKEPKADKAAKAKERQAKYDTAEDSLILLNSHTEGKTTVNTYGELIRGLGVQVTVISSTGNVSGYFVPGAKIKTKKAWKFLVKDNGPKPKKEAKAKK